MLVSSENVHRSVNDAADVWQNKESVSLEVLCSSGNLVIYRISSWAGNTCFLLWEVSFLSFASSIMGVYCRYASDDRLILC